MAAGPWIGVKALKMTFKGLLNERMSLDFQINIKEMKRELRQWIETDKSNYESHFLKYATTLYNQVPKQIQEAEIKQCPWRWCYKLKNPPLVTFFLLLRSSS